jgi:hypothetical protein
MNNEINKEQPGSVIENVVHIVQHAIHSNNMNLIKDMLLIENFHDVPKEQREGYAFSTSYFAFTEYGYDNVIKYLIFDYNISEANSIGVLAQMDIGLNIDPRVKQMFESNKLNQELNAELENNNEKYSKKPKV